jgi:hypothetical protein
MIPDLRSFFRIVAAALLLIAASQVQAAVIHLDGTYFVDIVRGADIAGHISQGDEVVVEAFYDTDLAVVREDASPQSIFYEFPVAGAGVRFTVNGLTWETAGPMTVAVTPVSVTQFHEDGSIAATYGGPQWLGYTDSRQSGTASGTAIQTPFGAESGIGKFMLYLPTFETELLPADLSLPTNLTVAQLAGPNFAHGAVAGGGPLGEYFFNFTSPVPEPSTYALMLAGLGLLGFSCRKRPAE